MKLLEEQQQRAEDVRAHGEDLNEATNSLKGVIKIYNDEVPETKRKYDELCRNYDALKKQRIDLQQKVKNMVIEINELIDEENKTNKQKCATLDRFNLLRMELDRYQTIKTKSCDLTMKYSEFEENVEKKSDELHKYFVSKWDEHEQKWSEWDINGIICWLKYLMHDNKLRLSKEFDLKTVEQKMMEQKIGGASLRNLDKNDLKELGFSIFPDRHKTYEKIRALVEKYPGPIQDVLFDTKHNKITADLQKEGHQTKVPQEYLCPISGKIMRDPWVAYDNKTYEKQNIIQYIQQNKRAPNCEYENDENRPLFRNRQLKTKIEQFLWANPSIKGFEANQ